MTYLTFELGELNVSVTGATPIEFEASQEGVPTGDGDATCVLSTSVAGSTVLKSFFRFHTDSHDIDDVQGTSDVTYDVSGNWPVELIHEAAVTSGHVDSQSGVQKVAFDLVRWMANELTGGIRGADIFGNEDNLRLAVATNNTSVANAIDAVLTPATGASNGLVYSMCDRILARLMETTDRRQEVADAIRDRADPTHMMVLPLKSGDVLQFKVTYKAAASGVVPGIANPIRDRSYTVVMTLA